MVSLKLYSYDDIKWNQGGGGSSGTMVVAVPSGTRVVVVLNWLGIASPYIHSARTCAEAGQLGEAGWKLAFKESVLSSLLKEGI